MIVLAFDIATATGVAWGEPSGKPQAVSADLGFGRPHGERYAKCYNLVFGKVDELKPDQIVIEASIGGKDASPLLGGYVACAQAACVNAGRLNVKVVAVSTIRSHFLGKNLTARHFPGMTRANAQKEIKARVIKQCHMIGWRPDDDDQADAMAAWDWACCQLSPTHQMTTVGGLFGERG